MKKISPLYDRVFIKRVEKEEKTAGGLYIPEGAKEKGQTGEVIAVGKGKLSPEGAFIPCQVKVGDTVFFGKFAGVDFDEHHLIIREEEILAVVQE